MKIYCILFDTCPNTPEIEQLIRSKGLHYCDYITNSFTTTSLVSLFTGKTPSEMNQGGIGYYGTYEHLEDKKEWDSKMLFNHLPDDWQIHIHGDKDNVHFVPEKCGGINREYKSYIHTTNKNEKDFLKQMQDLSSDENHFIFIKYNQYHDAVVYMEQQKIHDAVMSFVDIINAIDFEEENSLFWVFSDHGIPHHVDALMTPPHSWLTWVSVTDNIINKPVTKDLICVSDFFNTVLNRANNKFDSVDDVLSPVVRDKIYVVEDGRAYADMHNCTTVSAIRQLKPHLYRQSAHCRKNNTTRTIEYNSSIGKGEIVSDDINLLNYIQQYPWSWYWPHA